MVKPRASAEKFPGREDNGKNKTENSPIKPSSTLSVPYMKIHGAPAAVVDIRGSI